MLDLACLKKQLAPLVDRQKQWQKLQQQQLTLARDQLAACNSNWRKLAEKISRSKTSWLLAQLIEPPHKSHPAPAPPPACTVISSDGSQIFPDRHQLAPWYLINIGTVVIFYGSGRRPILRNKPQLFAADNPWEEESPPGREEISAYRNLMELQALAPLEMEPASAPSPRLALSDGTLIWWSLESKKQELLCRQFMARALPELDRLRQLGIPLAGYISRPGSCDVVNALRVGLCPQQTPDCERCPFLPHEPPCAAIRMATDRGLFAGVLKPGERSAIFRSSSKILNHYGKQHWIHFFYLHTGREIARIEIPQWVLTDPGQLETVHGLVYDQVRKGGGYPPVLAEAHQQAVVRAAERDLFYHLLEREFARHNLAAGVSRKLSSKIITTV